MRSASSDSPSRANDCDGALELSREPAGRLFPRGLDRSLELMRRGVDEPSRGAVENAFQLLHLAALDICERRLDPARRVGLLALDPAHEVALPCAQPLGDLMQRAPPLRRMRLELPRGRGCGFLGGPAEVITQPGDRRPLLLVRRLQAIRIAVEPRLQRLDQRSLSLRRSARGGLRAAAARGRDPGATPRAAARPAPAPSKRPRRARAAAAARSRRAPCGASPPAAAPPRRTPRASRPARERACARARPARSRSSRLRRPRRAPPWPARSRDRLPGRAPGRGEAPARRRRPPGTRRGRSPRSRASTVGARANATQAAAAAAPVTPAAASSSRFGPRARTRRRRVPPPPHDRRRRTRSRMRVSTVTQAS